MLPTPQTLMCIRGGLISYQHKKPFPAVYDVEVLRCAGGVGLRQLVGDEQEEGGTDREVEAARANDTRGALHRAIARINRNTF